MIIQTQQYDVLSPDGISISFDKVYNSEREAEKAFRKWAKNYERQGYYSSATYGKIPLEDLPDLCSIVKYPYEN